MEIAILNQTSIKMSELFTHKGDCPSSCSGTHLLNDSIHMRGHFLCYVEILAGFAHKVLCKDADLGVGDREHQVSIWPVTKQGYGSQSFDGELLLLQQGFFALFLHQFELDIIDWKRQVDTIHVFSILTLNQRHSVCRL